MAHYNLGLLLLTLGRFDEAWDHLEWRIRLTDAPLAGRLTGRSLWDGADLGGRRLLVQAEGGYGDTLHLARYVKLLARKDPHLIFLCHLPLARLFRTSGGFGRVVPEGASLPPFDVYCPLFSLPRLFSTTSKTIPADVPYLRARAGEAARWRKILSGPGLKVGLVWAGNPRAQSDRRRSMRLHDLAPLLEVPDVAFYSLQVGKSSTQIRRSGASAVTDLSPFITDFADTAASLSALDLLISVDTSVAHLAGALGRPVWVMLPYVPDWRWLVGREDSPWYPTMRLFRQTKTSGWTPVVDRIRTELIRLMKDR